MKARLNQELFTTTTFDSGSLGILASVVHQFKSSGTYHAVVGRNGEDVGSFDFEVSEKSTNKQLRFDLRTSTQKRSQEECCQSETRVKLPDVAPDGYVLFFVSSGTGYSVVVKQTTRDGEKFDSKTLGPKDIFALSVMRPAVYKVANTLGQAKGEILIRSIRDDTERDRLRTTNVLAAMNSFKPSKIEAFSTQGIVFEVVDAARIVIEPKVPLLESESKGPFRFYNFKKDDSDEE